MHRSIKSKEDTPVSTKFIGRHQQALFVKQLLDEDVTAMEMQIAANKDLSERNELVEKLERLEDYMRSDFFATRLDVSRAYNDIEEIVNKGYKNCVLQNDRELENRCLKIDDDTTQYAKKMGVMEGKLTEEQAAKFDKIIDLSATAGFLVYLDLGGILQTGDEQMAWMITSSLVNPDKTIGRFDGGSLIAQSLATLSKKDVGDVSAAMRAMNSRLLKNEKISEANARKVEDMIDQGLARNKEIHQEYPARP